MRIAYLINQYPKVTHSFIRREILALERQGFEIKRLALRGWSEDLVDDGDLRERERTHYVLRNGWRALPLAAIRMLFMRPVAVLRAIALAWRMSRKSDRAFVVHLIYAAEACRIAIWLRRDEVLHLHAHFGTNSAEVAMLVHVLGGPSWSFTVHGPEEFDKAQMIGLAEKIKACAFVIAVCSYGRSQLYRLVEYKLWPKVHIVHCGIEPDFYASANNNICHTRRLICVGRLCSQKGQLLLMQAAQLLFAQGVEFEIVLAGDGEMRDEIEALIARYNLQRKVRITGWISSVQVRSELLSARALVLPSFGEGLPVVIMEAMALRRPVISTYVAGIPELVVPGESGWLVPSGDVEALARAMHACLDAPTDEIMRLGAAAQRRVVAEHEIDREAGKLARLFSEVALRGE